MPTYEATKDGLPIGAAGEIWSKVSGGRANSFWTLGKPLFLQSAAVLHAEDHGTAISKRLAIVTEVKSSTSTVTRTVQAPPTGSTKPSA